LTGSGTPLILPRVWKRAVKVNQTHQHEIVTSFKYPMFSSGGKIHMSSATYELIRHYRRYDIEDRGEREIKVTATWLRIFKMKKSERQIRLTKNIDCFLQLEFHEKKKKLVSFHREKA
jgi:acyl-ACP thioesterase